MTVPWWGKREEAKLVLTRFEKMYIGTICVIITVGVLACLFILFTKGGRYP